MNLSLSPEGWPRAPGYAHGFAAQGRIVATAGQIGADPATSQVVSDDLVAQAGQALRNVLSVLRAGGAGPEHLVRLTWYITSRDEYLAARVALGKEYGQVVGKHFPAMAMVVVAALLDP